VPDYVLKQTGVPEELIQGFKVHAAQNRKLLQEVYDEAVADFLKQRAQLAKEKRGAPEYRATPNKGIRELNVRVRSDLADKVEKAAEDDGVPGRRLIYTALLEHAKKNKIIDR
jgi:hypothetical protein